MNSDSNDDAKIRATIGIVAALGEAIRDLNAARGGPVPSGELYAAVMGQLDINRYKAAIDDLVKARMVKVDSFHQLTWIGPKERNYLDDLAEFERRDRAKRLADNPDSQDPAKWEDE